ncbi:pyridoxal phosphate-dependent decarboxylase family protein [Natrinema salifodinae]|uniref:L-2,4-diaminobutyrate decarboxylase n=1 Tax=Natrinema salifodinae TaxID=1202768 RepID=A0A1I0QDE1_9EURY|nr:aspartate aminotransferase family protein [Natrinema salifodinae]SEW25061.1 L-2,4-diaminobutyrate decarboxylase [Natrinema salifodinae]
MTGGLGQASRSRADEPTPPAAASAFLGDPEGNAAYADAIELAREVLVESFATAEGPYAGTDHETLRERLADLPVVPDEGESLDAVLETVADEVLDDSVRVHDPDCVAHLHCPPTIPALAAEVVLSGTNQSLDSFDQAPAASVLEERVVDACCDLFDYPAGADGVFTGGGTESNLLGLLLARDWYCERRFDRDVQAAGLPPEAADLRLLCSEAAHFTADQAAHHLGLGEDAVVSVPTDGDRRMDVSALDETLDRLAAEGRHPFAIVGTAGTTDFGSIDPVDALADRAAERDLWLHVDAAYGGACAISDRLRPKLAGIDRADSIAVDFHKLFYQPIGCGAFLLRDGDRYRLLERNAAYLNPERDDAAGVPNLVSKSPRTTRRFDALKPFVTFNALGRTGLADCVEYVCDLADAAADEIRAEPALELCCEPELSAVVFRYRPDRTDGCDRTADRADRADRTDCSSGEVVGRVNRAIRDELFADGEALLARTTVDGTPALKFTLLNPRTTLSDLRDTLAAVVDRGEALEREVIDSA